MPQPQTTSNWFRVAVAGTTADGRVIEEKWIEQSAKNYKRDYYGARIFPEHIRGWEPGSNFKAQGDVLELKTQTDEINGEDRLCLYARIAPLPSLVDMVGAGEKIYTSVEIMESFADTGEAYMVGLAVTDSPASVGTEVLAFSTQHRRAQITDSIETAVSFNKESKVGRDKGSKEGPLRKMFRQIGKPFSTDGEDGGEASGDTMDELKKRVSALENQMKQLLDKMEEAIKEEVQSEVQEEIKELEEKVEEIEEKVDSAQEEYTRLSKTDASGTRCPAATGNNGYTLTNY